MPYQRKQTIFKVNRAKTASDEVWQLKFIKIEEDMSFQLGVDGIPIVSLDPDSVIARK